MRAALISAVFAALAVGSNAVAVEKRQAAAAPALTDADILNFALVLEHLEATFYAQALSNFSASDFTSAGYASNIRANIAQIAADEATHVSFLTTALTAAGATPVSACQYKFPYTDVSSFLALSQVLEGVGVSAYLGAAQYIQNPAYLTAAGAILTAEARHSAFVRYVNGYNPVLAFDTPLDPTSVQSLATPFFSMCPNGSAPPFTPFPAANLTTTNVTIGSPIQVSFANSTAPGDKYCIFLSGLNQAVSPYTNGSCMVPSQNVTAGGGQTYAVISSATTFSDATTLAGPIIFQLDTRNNTASSGSGATRGGSNSTVGSNAAAGATGAASKTTGVTAAAGLAMGLVAAAAATLF